MAMDFPSSPTVGQVFVFGGVAYTWNGYAWTGGPSTTALAIPQQPINLILNPNFHWDQAGIGDTGTSGAYPADGWCLITALDGVGRAGVSRHMTPNGSGQRLTAYPGSVDASIAAGQFYFIQQAIEGRVMAGLGWDTPATARPILVTFILKANFAGTFGFAIRQHAGTHSYCVPLTIAADEVDTDKQFAIRIPGPLVGAWATDNSGGMLVNFGLAVGTGLQAPSNNAWVAGNFFGVAGQSNLMASTANRFYIADVALYDAGNIPVGVVPPFEQPDPIAELTRCQRYWQQSYANIGIWCGDGNGYPVTFPLATHMRANPTIDSSGMALVGSGYAGGYPAYGATVTAGYVIYAKTAAGYAGSGGWAKFNARL